MQYSIHGAYETFLYPPLLSAPSESLDPPHRIPILSESSLQVFAKTYPYIPSVSEKKRLVVDVYCRFKGTSRDLTRTVQRLADAKKAALSEKITTLVFVACAVAAVVIPLAFSAFTENRHAVALARIIGFVALEIIGLIADSYSGIRQTGDLGEAHTSAFFYGDYGGLLVLPFYPLVAVYRIFNRLAELEKRVKYLQSETEKNRQRLKKYISLYSAPLKRKIHEEIALRRQEGENLSRFNYAFTVEKGKNEYEMTILSKALTELETIDLD